MYIHQNHMNNIKRKGQLYKITKLRHRTFSDNLSSAYTLDGVNDL